MKKTYLSLVTAIILTTCIQTEANAKTPKWETTKSVESAKADALLTRLYEINSIDKTDLTPPQKTKLRTEVNSIKADIKELGDGVYISVGAIIIILLLVIILL